MQIDIKPRLEAQALLAMRWGDPGTRDTRVSITHPLDGNHKDAEGNRVTRIEIDYQICASDPIPAGMRPGDWLHGEIIIPKGGNDAQCFPVLLSFTWFDKTEGCWVGEMAK